MKVTEKEICAEVSPLKIVTGQNLRQYSYIKPDLIQARDWI
jgi:hypothetical protein